MSRATGVVVGIDQHVEPERAGDMCEQLERRFPGVTFAIVTGASSVAFEFDAAVTPTAYAPPEEFTGVAFDRCPDATAQGRRDRCGQFSHIRLCDDTLCALAGEPITESGAHAPDPVDDTTTELDDTVWVRSTGRGTHDVMLAANPVPIVLASIMFTEGVKGRALALERFAAALGSVSQDVQR